MAKSNPKLVVPLMIHRMEFMTTLSTGVATFSRPSRMDQHDKEHLIDYLALIQKQLARIVPDEVFDRGACHLCGALVVAEGKEAACHNPDCPSNQKSETPAEERAIGSGSANPGEVTESVPHDSGESRYE